MSMDERSRAKVERLSKYPGLLKEAEGMNYRLDKLQQSKFITETEVDEMDRRITKVMIEIETIRNAISALDDPTDRLVLELRYMSGPECRLMVWREVMTRVFGDSSSSTASRTYHIHERALKRLHFPVDT